MRPSRHQMFLAMARAAAMRATCYRLNVGCILVHDRNVVGVGYNGAPSGQPHCTGSNCQYYTDRGCKVVHAEANALTRLADDLAIGGIRLELYTTHSPCGACVDSILKYRETGVIVVTDVYYETEYRDPLPMQTLGASGVRIFQVLPSGLLVDKRTGQLVDG